MLEPKPQRHPHEKQTTGPRPWRHDPRSPLLLHAIPAFHIDRAWSLKPTCLRLYRRSSAADLGGLSHSHGVRAMEIETKVTLHLYVKDAASHNI